MGFSHIVSANYRDRSSANRWLLRKWGQPPEKATAHQAIVASGVVFCPSTAFESGFGCSTVAYCEHAAGFDESQALPEGAVRLRFVGDSFYVNGDGSRHVEKCAQLILMSDGAMYAILGATAQSADATEKAVA